MRATFPSSYAPRFLVVAALLTPQPAAAQAHPPAAAAEQAAPAATPQLPQEPLAEEPGAPPLGRTLAAFGISAGLVGACGVLGQVGCSLVPLGFFGAATAVLSAFALTAARAQGAASGCVLVVGLIYATLLCIPGVLTLGPLSSTGAAAGAWMGSWPAGLPPRRLLGMDSPQGVRAWLEGILLRVLPLVGAAPGLCMGWGASAGVLAAVSWVSNTGQPPPWEPGIQPRSWQWHPGWAALAAAVLVVPCGGPLALLGAVGLPAVFLAVTDLRRDLLAP
ncbi:MAG: hypothetical protein HY904_07305 [Deltaproteobacteria bacterium]|nr:hypothetical protein [Deltaproteobacteria bacterium]